jgi:hypothetical protein
VPPRFRSSARGSTADVLRLADDRASRRTANVAQNSAETRGFVADFRGLQQAGSVARPFRPGQSGNPGGRPKGIAATVRRHCGANGKKLIEALVVIALGDDKARQNLFGERTAWPTLRDRMTAIEMLLERGFGGRCRSRRLTPRRRVRDCLKSSSICPARRRLRCRDTGSSLGLCQWRKPKTADRTAASTMTAASADRPKGPAQVDVHESLAKNGHEQRPKAVARACNRRYLKLWSAAA